VDFAIYVAALIGLATSGVMALWDSRPCLSPQRSGGFPCQMGPRCARACGHRFRAAVSAAHLRHSHARARNHALQRVPGWMRFVCHALMLIGLGLFVLNASLEMLSYLPGTEAAAWPSNTAGASASRRLFPVPAVFSPAEWSVPRVSVRPDDPQSNT